MTTRPITRELARYIADHRYEDLPKEAIRCAKDAVADQLGIMLMGSTLPWTQASLELVRDLGSKPECSIVGHDLRASALDAAYVNANFGHSSEFDDSGYDGGCHAGALTVPTALALATRNRRTGRDVLLAVTLGYEILSRIGRVATRPLLERGFHHQTVIGPFGAAAVAGKLLDLDAETMIHALSIAGSHASGTMEYDQSGGEVKRLHSAIAVRGGMTSAMLAQRGLTGPEAILEGLRGIPRVFAEVSDLEPIVAGLEDQAWYAIQGRTVKPYPTAGTIHTSIQAIASLMETRGLRPELVRQIDIGVNSLALAHGAAILQPTDTISAQFSLAFSVALRLSRGSNDFRHYADPGLWTDPEITALIGKIRIRAVAEMVGEVWYGSHVTVELVNGERMDAKALYRKGSPQDPLSDAELKEKFRSLGSAVLEAGELEEVWAAVQRLDDLDDVSTLMDMLVPSAPSPRRSASVVTSR